VGRHGGFRASEETKALMRLHHKGFLGKTHTKEAKEKMREGQRERWRKKHGCTYLTKRKQNGLYECIYARHLSSCQKGKRIICPLLAIELQQNKRRIPRPFDPSVIQRIFNLELNDYERPLDKSNRNA
jgi:hypothetical protein